VASPSGSIKPFNVVRTFGAVLDSTTRTHGARGFDAKYSAAIRASLPINAFAIAIISFVLASGGRRSGDGRS
jgi:hypothetical protein